MKTCYLFIYDEPEQSILSLCLNVQGEIEDPLLERDFASIKVLQKTAKIIIVLSSKEYTLHQVELPWLNEKKARMAIPFALEDKLAESLTELHFSFNKDYYTNNQYLVAVGNKTKLQAWISFLQGQAIDCSCITLDWFALHDDEAYVFSQDCALNAPFFKGTLSSELAEIYLQLLPLSALKWLVFDTDKPSFIPEDFKQENRENFYSWVATRLLNKKPINLRQGELRCDKGTSSRKRWYQATASIALVWCISFLGIHFAQIHSLRQKIAKVDIDIATTYRDFFPEAKQVISPKFRIMQRLKTSQTLQNGSFWTLLNVVATNITPAIQVEQLRLQNQTLFLTISTQDFDTLDSFQTQLQQAHIQVRQTQATTNEKNVRSTLELKA